MQRKVAAVDGRGQGVCLEEIMPALGPGEVKVRVEASLISPGTELGRVGTMRETPNPTGHRAPLATPTLASSKRSGLE